MRPVYHGWILVVREPVTRFRAAWREDGVEVQGPLHDTPDPAIAFWDARVGAPVRLLCTPCGGYRVYTEGPDPAPGTKSNDPEGLGGSEMPDPQGENG